MEVVIRLSFAQIALVTDRVGLQVPAPVCVCVCVCVCVLYLSLRLVLLGLLAVFLLGEFGRI
jgi:hypothetical protein